MLGMIMGVGVVILVVAIGEGAAQQVTEAVNSMGNNLLNVTPDRNHLRVGTLVSRGMTAPGAAAAHSMPVNSLTLQDVKLIERNFANTIEAVVPQIDSQLAVRLGSVDTVTEVAGTTIAYPYVKNTDVAMGRFFNQAEVDGALRVCVVGPSVAERLTSDGEADLTGKTLKINHQEFLVLGMLKSKGASSNGSDQDDVVLIPVSTAMLRVLNRQALNNVLIRCRTVESMPLAQEQVSVFLRSRHHLQPPFPGNDDFRIRNQDEILKAQQSVAGTMTSMLSIVAMVSLVVGGIGIMNIMLVSVTERTREIGIRKAVGATPRDVLLQFLIEAATISLLGGFIGIVMGVTGSIMISRVAGWNTVINSTAIISAVVVSVGVRALLWHLPGKQGIASASDRSAKV